MYFNNFENFIYEFNIGGKDTALLVKDITRNVRFRMDVLSNITVYDEYDILEAETPEHIAEKIYGNPQYHWIIMLVNERYDYLNDFPLSLFNLEKYINDNYDNPYDAHHYVNSLGFIVNSDAEGAYAVSNYEYETAINESKRRIKIVPVYYIDRIMAEFKKII
jgi:hypothetical protein